MTNDKPSVDLNLDAYAPDETLEPYSVVLGGKRYVLPHIDDLDAYGFVEAQQSGSDIETLKLALGDQFTEFRKNRLSRGALNRLLNRYLTHCGIDLGNSAS